MSTYHEIAMTYVCDQTADDDGNILETIDFWLVNRSDGSVGQIAATPNGWMVTTYSDTNDFGRERTFDTFAAAAVFAKTF